MQIVCVFLNSCVQDIKWLISSYRSLFSMNYFSIAHFSISLYHFSFAFLFLSNNFLHICTAGQTEGIIINFVVLDENMQQNVYAEKVYWSPSGYICTFLMPTKSIVPSFSLLRSPTFITLSPGFLIFFFSFVL